MGCHTVVAVLMLTNCATVITSQPASAAKVVTDAILSSHRNPVFPFQVPILHEDRRQQPEGIFNLGESFLLSRLRQGDRDAHVHVNQLQQSVDNPVSLVHDLFQMLSQPHTRRESDLFGLLHNVAVARRLIPNTHAFALRRNSDHFQRESPNEITDGNNLSSSGVNTTASIRNFGLIQQQMLETTNKTPPTVNEQRALNTPTSDLNTLNISADTQNNKTDFETQHRKTDFEVTRWKENLKQSNSSANNTTRNTNIVDFENNNTNGTNLSESTVDLLQQREFNETNNLQITKIKIRNVTSPIAVETIIDSASKPDENTVSLNNKSSLQNQTSPSNIPNGILRVGRLGIQRLLEKKKSEFGAKTVNKNTNFTNNIIVKSPKEVIFTNRSIIVEDDGLGLGSPMEIDIFSNLNISKNESNLKNIILQKVGQIDIGQADVEYQFVGDINYTVSNPTHIIQKVGELQPGQKRQLLMQVEGDSRNVDTTDLLQRIGTTNLVPGEIIRMHGDGLTRLVTRERVVIERLGFVNFYPEKNAQEFDVSGTINNVTIPVIRVEPLRKSVGNSDMSESRLHSDWRLKKPLRMPIGTIKTVETGKDRRTVLQFVGDLSSTHNDKSGGSELGETTGKRKRETHKIVKSVQPIYKTESLPANDTEISKSEMKGTREKKGGQFLKSVNEGRKGRLITVIDLKLNDPANGEKLQ